MTDQPHNHAPFYVLCQGINSKMKYIYILLCVLLAACASDKLQSATPVSDLKEPVSRLQYPYESSIQCRGCHTDQYQQYEESMHAKAFSNPLFNAQYFTEVVPRAQKDPEYVPEARRCIACHAPVVFMNYTGLVATPSQAGRFETGVTCDFCHTLEGFGENGDYIQVSSGKKQGPYQIEGTATHHSEYSGYMQHAEYCGNCHNATNHIGIGVNSTFDEWRESKYGMSGNTSNVTCQECHMSAEGFLRKGVAQFAKGKAAHVNIGSGGYSKEQKERDKLYNHSFPGAHSIKQQQDALLLEFKVGIRSADAFGRLPFTVMVNNERTGHKMPSGSSDLRFMWLVVTAKTTDGVKIPVLLNSVMPDNVKNYSVSGGAPDDAAILQDDVPVGVRMYRMVLVNSAGGQSLYQDTAVKNEFDNRLNAAEIRSEGYYLNLPTGFSGKVTLEANLYYRGAPSSFAKRMQVPDFSPVLVTSNKKEMSVEVPHASEK